MGCAGEGGILLVIEEVTAQCPNRCRGVDGDTRALNLEVGSHVVLEAAVNRMLGSVLLGTIEYVLDDSAASMISCTLSLAANFLIVAWMRL